jgi:tetratricopeptide (TPR) repeat protein
VDQFRWTPVDGRLPDPAVVAARTREALARFGADPEAVSADEAAARVAASVVRQRTVAALDRLLGLQRAEAARALLRRVDADPYRDAVRDAVLANDGAKLAALAGQPAALEQPAGFAASLGESEAVAVERRRQLLQAALAHAPGDLHLLMTLGGTYRLFGEDGANERLRWYQAAVAAAPGNAIAHIYLCITLQDKGQYDEASACFHKASELDPKHSWPHHRLGWILWEKGDLDGAEREFREAVRLEDFHGFALDELAELLESRGNWDGAIAVYQEFLRINPKDAGAHVGLGYALAGKGQVDEALACYKKAVELARQALPQDSPMVAHHFARKSSKLLDRQKWAEAELLVRECLALREKVQPLPWDSFDPKSMLGEALLGQKKYAEAEPLLLAAYQGMKKQEATNPAAAKARLPEAALRLVRLYEALGKKDEAARWQKEREALQAPAKKPETKP